MCPPSGSLSTWAQDLNPDGIQKHTEEKYDKTPDQNLERESKENLTEKLF